ncbi:MAG: hypothetical protein KIT34_06800 [Cyanobacteria bacterium TGS_CYA1]|nr:hypothetical protein [Cyanobacteria bacterium TGS_CYA1]
MPQEPDKSKIESEDIDIESILCECLSSLSNNLFVIAQIAGKLASKRTTLEERMIRNTLHQLGSTIGMSVTSFHQNWLDDPGLKAVLISGSVENLNALLQLSNEINKVLQEFLKMANYNLNFLEQYYEYDFNAKLLYEYRFNERLQEQLKLISLGSF